MNLNWCFQSMEEVCIDFPLTSSHFSVSCCHGTQPFKEVCSVEFVLRVSFSSVHPSLYQLNIRSIMNFFSLCWSGSKPQSSLKQITLEVGNVCNQSNLEKFEIQLCHWDVWPMTTDKEELGVVVNNQRKLKKKIKMEVKVSVYHIPEQNSERIKNKLVAWKADIPEVSTAS